MMRDARILWSGLFAVGCAAGVVAVLPAAAQPVRESGTVREAPHPPPRPAEERAVRRDLTPREIDRLRERRRPPGLSISERPVELRVVEEPLYKTVVYENYLREAGAAGFERLARPPMVEACVEMPRMRMSLTPDIDSVELPCLDWKEHVFWTGPDGRHVIYEDWPAGRKARLNEIYTRLVRDEVDLGLSCPDPQVSLDYMTRTQARDVYLAHVAFALWLDSTGKLPWRLWMLPGDELAEILSPYAYFQPIPAGAQGVTYPANMGPGQGYRLPFRRSYGQAMVCDPRVGYRFMTRKGLIGADEEETLARISSWTRDEVGHGANDLGNARNHALLKDRLARYRNTAIQPQPLTAYWAHMGCHTAGATIADLARSVNIPVRLVGTRDVGVALGALGGTHTGLLFRWQRSADTLLQWHTDELYATSYHWIVLPTAGSGGNLQPADSAANHGQFFERQWRTPADMGGYGFDYGLNKIVRSTPMTQCTTRCDFSDYGWDAGGWKKGSREDVDQATAVAAWETYFNSVKDQVMSDGSKCYETDWHPECLAEVTEQHDKIYGTYYANELVNGFHLANDYFLGGYPLLSHRCLGLDMAHYVDLKQGQPSPHGFSVQQVTTRADEVATAYGGCAQVDAAAAAIQAFKTR